MAQRKSNPETSEKDATTRSPQGPSANTVTLIGRLTADAELRTTSAGISVTTFRIAINGRTSEFFSVVAWRQQAEFVTKWLGKGRLVHVSGRLQSRTWEAADGSSRHTVEVVADRVQALSAKPMASAE
jgi:single-strand DNA-binding protein